MTTRQTMAILAGGMLAAAALVAIVIGTFCELLVAIPLPAALYGAASLVVLVGSALVIGLAPRRGWVPATSIGCVLTLVFLAVLHFVPWTSRKPFLHALGRVEAGMTQAEVDRIMAGYMRGTGWPTLGAGAGNGSLTEVATGASYAVERAPDGELGFRDSVVFRHSDDATFNSDWGVVRFRDGKVAAVEFMPD